ncbi:MAG: hypothetical protein ACLFRV_03940 [Acidimicrobiales bacterium]
MRIRVDQKIRADIGGRNVRLDRGEHDVDPEVARVLVDGGNAVALESFEARRVVSTVSEVAESVSDVAPTLAAKMTLIRKALVAAGVSGVTVAAADAVLEVSLVVAIVLVAVFTGIATWRAPNQGE